MDETNRHLELLFGGDHKWHPDGSYSIYRSDDPIGIGGRLLVSRLGPTHWDERPMEVPYSKLSLFRLRDVIVEGIPVARVRRTFDGNIVGEWVHLAAERTAVSPPGDAPPQAPGGETGTTQSGSGNVVAGALQLAGALFSRVSGAAASPPGDAPPQAPGVGAGIAQALSGDTMASALQLAGTLLSKSSGKGLQTLGSLLSSVSQGIGQSSGPETLAGNVAPKLLSGNGPGLPEHSAHGTSRVDSGPGQGAAPEATAEVERAVAGRAEPAAIPTTRSCDGCAHFRPYVRISERLTEELGPSLSEEAVSRALNELVSQEEKGKGEEARRLADLYKRGKDRWGIAPHLSSPIAPRMSEISGSQPSSLRRYVIPIKAAGLSSAPTASAGMTPRPTSHLTLPSRTAATPVGTASRPRGRGKIHGKSGRSFPGRFPPLISARRSGLKARILRLLCCPPTRTRSAGTRRPPEPGRLPKCSHAAARNRTHRSSRATLIDAVLSQTRGPDGIAYVLSRTHTTGVRTGHQFKPFHATQP